MAAVTIQQLDPALLQLVKDDVAKVFEQEAVGWTTFKKNTKSSFVNGKGFRIPIYPTPPGGHTWFSENASSFNNPNPYEFKDMYVWPTAYALPFEFTGRVIRNEKDSSSMLRWFGEQLAMYVETGIKEIEEQLPYDGRGIKAIVEGDPSATTTLTGQVAFDATAGGTKGTKYLTKGAQYDIIDPAAGTVRAGSPITVTVPGPASVTTLAAMDAAVADGDLVVHVGGYNKAFRGLAYLINNGSGVLQLLSRADFPELRSPVTDLANTTMGPASFSKTKANLMYRAGKDQGAKNLIAFLSFGQYEYLRRQGYNLRRFMDSDTVTGVAGSYTDGDTTFLPNTNVDEDRCYLLDLTDIERYVEMDFGLYDLDGQTIRMKLGTNGVGSDNYTGAIGICMNLGITAPMKHALIKRAAISDTATQVGSYA
jgi:hypothetical protein